MSKSLTIDYDESILVTMGLTDAQFSHEARFLLAAKLYELGKLTSGEAARFCGKGRVDFLLSLPGIGVPMSNLRTEDIDDDIRFGLRG